MGGNSRAAQRRRKKKDQKRKTENPQFSSSSTCESPTKKQKVVNKKPLNQETFNVNSIIRHIESSNRSDRIAREVFSQFISPHSCQEFFQFFWGKEPLLISRHLESLDQPWFIKITY